MGFMSLERKEQNKCLFLAFCGVLAVVWFVYKNTHVLSIPQPGRDNYFTQRENKTDDSSQLVNSQQLFDGGLYNFTVVSGMINIGRGKWKNLNRTYEQYLRCFKQVLGLKVNLVLYVDAKAKAFAEEQRRGMESRTHIIETTLRDTPYYKLYPRMAEIMNSTEYKKDNELFKLNLPEALYPDYVIITWTKLYFIDRTIKENPFKNNFFIWLDGGYGHCAPIFPASHIWRPRGLFEHADKVTFIELGKGIEEFRNVKDKIHKMSIAVINGGFIAGGTSALQKLYSLQNKQVEEWMDHGIVDDEQTVYLTLCYKYPSMFHLVRGTWHDAFKLFNSEK